MMKTNNNHGGKDRLPPATRRRLEREQRERCEDVTVDPDDLDTPEADFDETDLVALLERIERQRARLQDDLAYFHALLDSQPELQELWQKFTRAGGASASDLRQFLQGTFRCRLIRQRRHLRLIVSKARKPLVLNTAGHGGDHAA